MTPHALARPKIPTPLFFAASLWLAPFPASFGAESGPVAFARAQIADDAARIHAAPPDVAFTIDPHLGAQCYTLKRAGDGAVNLCSDMRGGSDAMSAP
jgi:hypothetical protein